MLRKKLLQLAGFLFCISNIYGNAGSPSTEAVNLYHKADRLFNLSQPSETSDSIALATFEQIIKLAHNHKDVPDSILFQCFLKKGILLEVAGNYSAAKESYLKAISFKKEAASLPDSLSYKVYVYTGSVYYTLNNYDSANYFLQLADGMTLHYPGIGEKERLYNALGALYYENGNYLQSKNYFSRALEIISRQKPSDVSSAINFENNIAVSCYKLGLFEEAIARYKKIYQYKLYRNYTSQNMGKAYAAMGNYREALTWFRKTDPKQIPGVLNEVGKIYWQLKKPDSARYFLDRLQSMIPGKNHTISSVDVGINHLYRADLLTDAGDYLQALALLQKAINLFAGNFSNTNIFENPSGFTGLFASYRLFDALYKKAITFEKLYHYSGKSAYLEASCNAFNSVIALSRYIEKNYDTDDAKIFLKQNSRPVYEHSLDVNLLLYKLHNDQQYLEKAFLTGEKNKGSIMSTGLQSKWLANMPGIDQQLLQKERNIKYNIARLNIRLDQAGEKEAIAALAKEKAGYEIELSKLQKQLEQNSQYYQSKYEDAYPALDKIQAHILPTQAVISFYAADPGLHVFIVTTSSLQYFYIDSLQLLKRDITGWLTLLRQTEDGRKFSAGDLGNRLYRQLVKPIQERVGNKEQWIIIPDDILHLLPFESLPVNNTSEVLLETKEISYQFSAKFIIPRPAGTTPVAFRVLSFAPFAGNGNPVRYPESGELFQLPSSLQEVAGLPGKNYIDSSATREEFLREVTHYPVIHLATHAVSDIHNTSGSFIAFYPRKGIQAEDCLYLDELYGLNMDSTQLVVISACETGQGKLVSSEGAISLSRGFLYAGCRGTINSLWKADDKATAAILQQFYHYLQKGYTKSKALQQAKLDYIKSDALHRTPNYWSHLVLTGDTGALIIKGNIYSRWNVVAAIAGLAGIIIVLIIWRKRKKEKSRRGFSQED